MATDTGAFQLMALQHPVNTFYPYVPYTAVARLSVSQVRNWDRLST